MSDLAIWQSSRSQLTRNAFVVTNLVNLLEYNSAHFAGWTDILLMLRGGCRRTHSGPTTSAVRQSVLKFGLWTTGGGPLQAQQSAQGEDEDEHPSHAQHVKRPDKQEGWAGPGDRTAKNTSRPHHMDDRNAQRQERPDKHDDVPRPPFGQHQRSIEPDDQDGHHNES